MYNFNNKIMPLAEHRQKIFDELIHFGYTKSRIKEYRRLRENEIGYFGDKKYKNTDIKAELKNFLTAFTFMAYLKGNIINFEISGKANGYILNHKLEYSLSKLLSEIITHSYDKELFIKVNITLGKIKLTLKYKGERIENLSNKVYYISFKRHNIINFTESFVSTKHFKEKPKSVYEWIGDRLSDININLIDI